MAKISEATFGNKLAKGQQLSDYIHTLNNYNPPNEALKKDKFKDLLKEADEINKKVASTSDLLTQAREKRSTLYYGKEGIKKRSAMVRDFVGVLPAGKDSHAYTNIQKEVQKMSNYKKPTKKEETSADNEVVAKRTVSSSETSFGSVLQGAKNILEVVKNLPNYAPANALISITGFTDFIATMELANQAVNTNLFAYSEAISKRQELYAGEKGMQRCFQDIKSFIAASYGKDSAEFKEVSKLKY
jgi:hypothetical protein